VAQYDDPRILRAIAHPARNRILAELDGQPLRAADLARILGVPANQVSFHLRQLAKYGLIEEAPEEARDRRDRVWRLVDGGIRFRAKDVVAQPGGRAAVAVFNRHAVGWGQRLVEAAFSPPEDDPEHEVERYVFDASLHLTAAEVGAFAEEFDALLEQWRERTRGRGGEGRTTYSVYQMLQPYPDDLAADPAEG
jgi:DNA-binding transcriptional ArsR family regulator